jgi:hypothetical protein
MEKQTPELAFGDRAWKDVYASLRVTRNTK